MFGYVYYTNVHAYTLWSMRHVLACKLALSSCLLLHARAVTAFLSTFDLDRKQRLSSLCSSLLNSSFHFPPSIRGIERRQFASFLVSFMFVGPSVFSLCFSLLFLFSELHVSMHARVSLTSLSSLSFLLSSSFFLACMHWSSSHVWFDYRWSACWASRNRKDWDHKRSR